MGASSVRPDWDFGLSRVGVGSHGGSPGVGDPVLVVTNKLR